MSVETAISQLRTAEHSWQSALKQHRLAPPDAGYSRRLRDLANACEQQQIAFQYAAKAGVGWDPFPPTESRKPPPELRPESGRRGDPQLWQRFDGSVEDLAKALEAISLAAIALLSAVCIRHRRRVFAPFSAGMAGCGGAGGGGRLRAF